MLLYIYNAIIGKLIGATVSQQTNEIFLCISEKQEKEYSEFIADLSREFKILNLKDLKDKKTVRVLLLGGDGSLNYFVNNILKENEDCYYEVIYFPTGTANDFARSLKINPDKPSLDKIHSIIQTNSRVKIPLMSCNDKFFINVASAGSPAKVTNSGEDFLKNLTGKISYYIAAFEEVLNPETYKITCKFEGDVKNFNVHGFLISQGLYAGGGVKVSTSYTPNFGEVFNFISFNGDESTELVKAIVEMQKDDPVFDNNNFINIFSKEFEITSNKSIPVKLDGEDYESDKFIFKKEIKAFDLFLH